MKSTRIVFALLAAASLTVACGEEEEEAAPTVGPKKPVAAAPVHLDSGANDHVLQRSRALGGREHRFSRLLREHLGVPRVGARIGFPHPEVDDGVRIDVADESSRSEQIGWIDAVELGAGQTSSGRIGVETDHGVDPRLLFELTGDEGPELTSHPGDQDAPTVHGRHEITLLIRSTRVDQRNS